jgi:hypothetical protein
MSKYRIGNYDTGEPRFKYFKRWKHFKSKYRKIRETMWIANSYKFWCNVD